MSYLGKTTSFCRWLAVSLGRGLLDSICPPACGLCRGPEVSAGAVLCHACLQAIGEQMSREYCPRCGSAVPPYGLRPTGCGDCPPGNPPFDGVIRVGFYSGAFAELVRVFKYRGREELTGFFVGELSRRLARSDIYEPVDAITYVPTCWQHRLRRVFYPPQAIARELASRCGIPLADVLERTGGGPHQINQSPTARRHNVRGKFRLARGCSVDGARLCLIDDVMTTGATVGECAKVLQAAGAEAVCVAVLAKTSLDATGPVSN